MRLGCQPKVLDRCIDTYNRDHPHQAIGMHYPAELYQTKSGLSVSSILT
jgi:hypothetical protein